MRRSCPRPLPSLPRASSWSPSWTSESSRFLGARKAREAFDLDPDLADVARFVALLLAEQKRFASGARFMEAAANLYGPRSAEGREAQRHAEEFWRRARVTYGEEPGR